MSPLQSRERRWVFAPTDRSAAERLAGRAGVSPVVAQLLLNRGVDRVEAARSFLQPNLNDLHEPELLPGIAEAADRIGRAIRGNEKIVVYGDYDVDGVCATTILMECIEVAGARASYYLPARDTEGYGLNTDAVRTIAEDGADLLITVDCGVTAVAEAAVARQAGLDLIITDHHEPGPEQPDALAVINPHLPDSPYPFQHLAGAGVAFKLAWAVGKSLSPSERVSPAFRSFLMDAVALAGMGTIADVVPLVGENRVLASYGLEGLRRSTRPGIRALCRAASADGAVIDAWDVAFKLAPRLNAAGRLGSARRGVDLLTTKDEELAVRIARELDGENARRQKMQQRMLSEATAMIEASGGLAGRLGLVLAHESWHAGVVGVVAGRVADQTARPTVAIALDGDEGRGSARSSGALNLYEVLADCEDLLLGFGGHAQAAGLRVAADKVDAFRERFEQAVRERVSEEDLVPTVDVELEARLPWLSMDLVREIEKLGPFGAGNPSPVFASRDVAVVGTPRRMGASGKHLTFWANQDGVGLRAVAFNMGEAAPALARDGTCSIAYAPKINSFRGNRSVEIEVKDMKFGVGA